MEERRSMGSALVDVFDAAVVLVKSEINAVTKKVTEIVKVKGVGIVLLLGAVGPLLLGLIFLILFVFYGLMRLGLGAWAAALLLAIVSLALAGGLALLGIKKLTSEVDTELPRHAVPVTDAPATATNGTGNSTTGGNSSVGYPAGAVPVSSLRYPVSAGSAGTTAGASAYGYATANAHNTSSADAVNASGSSQVGAQPSGYETLSTEEGSTTVPVYESKPGGEAQAYGSGLNKKLEGHDDHDDPNLRNPVVVQNAPGISVSTDPTYREDMKKEGY